MDIIPNAAAILPYLLPALPVLVQTGKDITEVARKSLVDRIGKGASDVACRLWSRISGTESAKKAAERVAADPENSKKQTALEVEIDELLLADTAFVAEIRQLLAAIGTKIGGNVVNATGDGSVAVGGNVGGGVSTNVSSPG
ncbi:MAG: hypothetical protein JWO38_2166 [Gemmataceae bacterium]|nr:hypothetical protein [Gemmataceae bacterium]